LPISAQKADESTITEPATSNIDEDELMLQWPSSPHDADTMDVDVPPEVPSVGVRRRGTSTERESIESASSCGKSNNVQQRAAGSATLRNGVSPTNFYGSVSDKGKQKATPMPHPFDIPNEGEQEVEIDELIGSQEPSKTEGRPMYVLVLVV
jgi:hypothetical protein